MKLFGAGLPGIENHGLLNILEALNSLDVRYDLHISRKGENNPGFVIMIYEDQIEKLPTDDEGPVLPANALLDSGWAIYEITDTFLTYFE